MDNYTLTRVSSQEDGTLLEEYHVQDKHSLYTGPRKYWRVMELYDKAQLLLGSKVGIHIMIYLKQKVSIEDYRIQINQSWLAEDIGATREAVAKNIKKLIDNEYLIKEKRGKYFINPKMFWIAKMSDIKWQKLKEDFEFKLNDINFQKMAKKSTLTSNR